VKSTGGPAEFCNLDKEQATIQIANRIVSKAIKEGVEQNSM
jgi:hypothetical protein